MPCEEYVGSSAGVVCHPDFTSEGDDTFHPAALDGRDESGVWVESPVPANLAAQPKLLTVGRQQQFDCGRVEANAMIKCCHTVALVDSADHHHGDQDLDLADQPWIARE